MSHEVTSGNTMRLRSRGYAYTSYEGPVKHDEKMMYSCYQMEKCPTTGRVHAQGYIRFYNQIDLKTLKQYGKTIHWEIAHGTVQQNKAYCSKPNKSGENVSKVIELSLDGGRVKDNATPPSSARDPTPSTFQEFGKIPSSQGKRTDLDEIGEEIDSGVPLRTIAKNFTS